jgi:hypothetical protein
VPGAGMSAMCPTTPPSLASATQAASSAESTRNDSESVGRWRG